MCPLEKTRPIIEPYGESMVWQLFAQSIRNLLLCASLAYGPVKLISVQGLNKLFVKSLVIFGSV